MPIEIVPSTFEENLDKSSFQEAWQYAVETARRKAREVAERLKVFILLESFSMLHNIHVKVFSMQH